MQKKHISWLFCGAAIGLFLKASPAFAFGFPTLDLTEVFNTIQSVVSQGQSTVSTVQETVSIANIQQSIGDKHGGLSKLKDWKDKAEKLKEKAEKAKKRAEKVQELKKKYEDAKKFVNDAEDKYKQAMDTVNDIKTQAENVQKQVEDMKNQVTNTVNDVKNQIDNVQNQVEGVRNQVEGVIDNAQNQVVGAVNGVKNQIDNAQGTVTGLYGGEQKGFEQGTQSSLPVSSNNGVFYDSATLGHSQDDFVGAGYDASKDTFVSEDQYMLSNKTFSTEVNKVGGQSTTGMLAADDLWRDNESVELSASPLAAQTKTFSGTQEPNKKLGEKNLAAQTGFKEATSSPREAKTSVKSADGGILEKSSDMKEDVEKTTAKPMGARKAFEPEVDEDVLKEVLGFQEESGLPLKVEEDLMSETEEVDEEDGLSSVSEKVKEELSNGKLEAEVEAAVSVKNDVPGKASKAPEAKGDTPMKASKAPEAKGDTPMKAGVSTQNSMPKQQEAPQRKAFEKVSYNNVFMRSFAAQSETFKTGTDENANYYFPDTFASWVGINYDDKLDVEVLDKAVNTICRDLNTPNASDVEKYKAEYMKLIAEALSHAQAYSASVVKDSESDQTEEDLDNMIDKASEDVLSQKAGTAEILIAASEQNKYQLVMLADQIQVKVWDHLLSYCNNGWSEEE